MCPCIMSMFRGLEAYSEGTETLILLLLCPLDAKELQVATTPLSGINMSGGTWETSPTFVDSAFQLDFLTKPTALLELGIDAVVTCILTHWIRSILH